MQRPEALSGPGVPELAFFKNPVLSGVVFPVFTSIVSRGNQLSKNIRHGDVDIDLMVQGQHVYNGRTTP
jgi:hypothetical protein